MLEPSGKQMKQEGAGIRAAARLSVAPMMDWTDSSKSL